MKFLVKYRENGIYRETNIEANDILDAEQSVVIMSEFDNIVIEDTIEILEQGDYMELQDE